MSEHFPDRQHIEVIRNALWTERSFGRAAVMVGAGMSLNAEVRRPGRQRMPTWWDLVNAIIDQLYPINPNSGRQRKKAFERAGATSGFLQLAEEYAAAFGRSMLDDLVLRTTPDADFEPGHIHRLLLELPWADVLTTNYDTLLERAATSVLGQRYSVVQTPEEIPASARPRIVKLHGSFPSTRPFILTEEDFRKYPRQFAPFVNLAQQVVMENIVCLIGFSGDDPNFLYWTGWVRDHLGVHAPRIYLCGLLELSDSMRRVLHNRNVVPIDLSPLFPRDKLPDVGLRHRAALEWLFLSLRAGRKPNPLDWPTPPRDHPLNKRLYPLELLPPPSNRPKPERWGPQNKRT